MAENVGRRGDSWYYRLDLPPGPDGRRRQKRVSGFPTEREARKALAKAAVDVQEGRLRFAPMKTVAAQSASPPVVDGHPMVGAPTS